jgi:hypothetical protein
MVGYPVGSVVFELFFQAHDLASKVEVLGQQSGAFILERPDAIRLVRVDFGEVSILSQKLATD